MNIRLPLFIALLVSAGSAFAAEVPFNQAQYQRDLAAGKPVVVYFHADWCPTCRIQQPIVAKLAAQPSLAPVTIFEADFDTETALEKSLHVTQQSTFVVFRHGHEVTRSTGLVQSSAIGDELHQAL